MAVILVVEDNKHTQLLTAARLKPFFDVVCADGAEQAFEAIYSRNVDLIVSDIMMPVTDGYDLLKRLRGEGFEMPVILLTAKHTFEDKREGFNAGTDDYMTKPVNYDELLLRINALLRRAKIAAERKIVTGGLVVDSEQGAVTYNGTGIKLTRREFDLLFKLMSNAGKILTKNQLLDQVWGLDSDCTEDTVKTHINRLRNKLAGCSEVEIVTIKGFGYKAETKNRM